MSDVALTASRAPRVLHLIGSLGLGGIETWLMHVFRKSRGGEVDHEVLFFNRERGVYEAELEPLGIASYRLPLQGAKLSWLTKFRSFLRNHGPFDAVHAHALPHFNAMALAVAAACGVPNRIAHNHSARTNGTNVSRSLRLKTSLARPALAAFATHRIGISEPAVTEIAGTSWRKADDASILLYGFDFSPFDGADERGSRKRRELGLTLDHRVVGSVGRFVKVKNHRFLLQAFAHCARREPEARLVLVGEGPLEAELRALSEELNIADRVVFAGTTRDVPAFMAMFDLFCLPSDSEGLGIVAVEAQAGGTPVLASTGVPSEAFVVKGGARIIDVQEGAEAWGAGMAELLGSRDDDRSDWQALVEESKFGLDRCIRELRTYYPQSRAYSAR